jgi:hypothetical protein
LNEWFIRQEYLTTFFKWGNNLSGLEFGGKSSWSSTLICDLHKKSWLLSVSPKDNDCRYEVPFGSFNATCSHLLALPNSMSAKWTIQSHEKLVNNE